jgi:hypothetical protein
MLPKKGGSEKQKCPFNFIKKNIENNHEKNKTVQISIIVVFPLLVMPKSNEHGK